MRRLNRVVTKIYDDALRPFGITTSQMNILVAVACLDPARPAALGRELRMDLSTLSRNAERMRRKGWITAEADPKDARARQYRASAAGRDLLESLVPSWRDAQDAAARLLGAEEIATLMGAGDRVKAVTQPTSE